MRAWERKKKHRQWCLSQVRKGLGHRANGEWYSPASNDTTALEMFAGYRVIRSAGKKKKAA
jgi:hypothetical protein